MVFFLGFEIWDLGFAAPRAEAACWCSDATYCTCANTKKTDYYVNRQVGFDSKTKTSQFATIYCDSQAELDSEFRQAMPVCGGSPEILPYCAYKIDTTLPDGIDTHSVTCYGIEFFKGTTNIPSSIPENKLQQMNGPVVFTYTDGSTKEFGDSGTNEVLWCNSIAFCCARGDIKCSDDDVPKVTADSYCTNNIPHLPNQTKASTCTGPSGAGESRLFIPHLKNISFLATLLQSIFNPAPSSLSNNALPAPKDEPANVSNPDVVTTKIQYHQGLDDNTQIVNQKDNNSSLKVNAPAPSPLYNYNGTRQYQQSAYCSIADTRVNPGDDLLGPKIETTLRYTQKYTYDAFPSANCVADSGETDSPALCCSNKAAGVPATEAGVFPGSHDKRYICGTLPGNRYKTEGRIAVFTKSPLVEYIYSTLVTGPQSVLKRIFPQGNPTEFKEIPGEAKYVATAPGADLLKVGSNSDTPTIYVPHLGSLYDYFLQGLQKALRPFGFSSIAQLPSPTGDCNSVAATITNVPDCKTGTGLVTHYACYSSDLRNIFESAGSAYNVAPDLLAAIASIESRNLIFEAPLDQPFLCQANACGAMGAMQLLTGYGVQPSCSQAQSDPSTANWAKYACKTNGQVPNPGNINDSIYSAASMISAMGIGSGANWTQDQVLELGYRYFGSKTQTFPLRDSINMANSCLDSSIKPIIYENEMTYGDYLWYYYAPRNNKVIIPPLPSPTPRIR